MENGRLTNGSFRNYTVCSWVSGRIIKGGLKFIKCARAAQTVVREKRRVARGASDTHTLRTHFFVPAAAVFLFFDENHKAAPPKINTILLLFTSPDSYLNLGAVYTFIALYCRRSSAAHCTPLRTHLASDDAGQNRQQAVYIRPPPITTAQ